MRQSLRVANIGKECVACGCCILKCPQNALSVQRGIRASVKYEKCIGCGKCADICPAAVITMIKRGSAE